MMMASTQVMSLRDPIDQTIESFSMGSENDEQKVVRSAHESEDDTQKINMKDLALQMASLKEENEKLVS